MAVLNINYYCDYIQMSSVFQVILPTDLVDGRVAHVPAVFLLAPEGEEASRWVRCTQAELLADQYRVAMVLVSGLTGCYTDMAYGYPYFQSLAKGIPDYIGKNIPALKLDDGQCYAAGCSMGGMGAVKLALSCPERFAAAGSFSGRLDNAASFENPVKGDWLTEKRMINLWGSPDAIKDSADDLAALADKAIKTGKTLPALYLSAGTQDTGFASSQAFAATGGLDVTFAQRQGRQGWPSWSKELAEFLNWVTRKGEMHSVLD